jgi:hypothetical protein
VDQPVHHDFAIAQHAGAQIPGNGFKGVRGHKKQGSKIVV